MLKRFDHFTIACGTFLIAVLIAAIVILVDTHHSTEVKSAVIALTSLAGSAITLGGIQSLRNGVGKTNSSIENGVLKEKIKQGVEEALQERASANPRERASDKNQPTP